MTTTIREFSVAGPCIPLGELIRETPKFYVVADRFRPGTRKVAKSSWGKTHAEPCSSCRDHAATQFPNGYMD